METKSRQDWIQSLCDSSLRMVEIMRPPTDQQLTEKLSAMSNTEVYGLYKWGSKKGRRLAKIECLKRGLISPSFFKWLFNKLK